jgi:cell wall-associated NlpC family hydrolase
MTRTGRGRARLLVAALLTLPLIFGSLTASSAAPSPVSQSELDAARQRVGQLEQQLELAVEQWNEANVRLDDAKARLAQTQRQLAKAQAEADDARGRLAERAVEAYTGVGTQVDVLLDAESMTEFSDRLEFMGAIAQSDADLAAEAEAAGQRAEWAAAQREAAVAEVRNEVQAKSDRLDEIKGMLAEQQSLYEQLNRDSQRFQDYMAAQEAAAAAAARQAAADAAAAAAAENTVSPPPAPDPPVTVSPPPPVSGAAGVAVRAALSVVNTQYVWGAADPSVGFDCSGLTMWAWGQAGVSLVHSSAAQYASLPHVSSMAEAQPGDLLFFYSPISHVAMYIGGGMMVHARHPGPGGQVQTGSVAGYGTPVVGIARPG